ncbi:MAG: hypothetical protein K2P81_00230 [Bacteriovoracaceae bacterium]|nr:hypothetical protein [Bacteriovoracaceae bacterium]
MKFLLVLVLLSACSSEPVRVDNPSTPYQTAGNEQFFLPELPAWVNGSLSAQCLRSQSVRYMDYTALEKIHGLDFKQKVELQTQYNRKLKERYSSNSLALSPQEESVLFLESLELVKGGLKDLRFPTNSSIHLVWLDSFNKELFAKKWLEKLGNKGEPVVLISLCQTASKMEDWIEEQELDDYGFYLLGIESMGPSKVNGEMAGGAIMPLDAFFPFQSTTLWIKGIQPAEFPNGYTSKIVEDTNVR